MNKGDRIVAGFELSEEYCEIVCQRFQSLTAIAPVKVGNINSGNETRPQLHTSDIPESLGF